ncbi:MAG: M48 family metalloprotease [Alphaproteobacteria bacterium]|nr:M48 family metalloprotease [Alphaproteobacteria bacterium]
MFLRFLLAVFILLLPPQAYAQSADMVIVRDTEVEDYLKAWSKPLIQAAGLSPETVRFILVQSPDLNAFVAGGPNIFIYTGLIERTKTPNELLGVTAHELGHISGGHLIRARGAMENASFEAILGTVLGLGVAALTGEGGAASAGAMLGQSVGMTNYLHFSRTQEASADQAAMRFLASADMSSKGFLEFFKTLEDQELLPAGQQNAYVRTHPLTRDRITTIEARLQGGDTGVMDNKTRIEQHKLMRAKLIGYTKPQQVNSYYPANDTSVAARYAHAIALYRKDSHASAISLMDGLLKEAPANPYFKEQQAQILFASGKVNESIALYRAALGALPHSAFIRMDLAQALLSRPQATQQELQEVIALLKRAKQDEPRMPKIYRLLATAYGRAGDEKTAHLNLAEEAFLKKDKKRTKELVKRLEGAFPAGSREYIQLQDLLQQIKTAENDED